MIEILVAAAMLGVAIFIVTTVIRVMQVQTHDVVTKGDLPKVVESVLSRVNVSEIMYPGWPESVIAASQDPYEDPALSTRLCFRKDGYEVPLNSQTCYYKVSYYRQVMSDGKFAANSDLAILPMNRVFIRIRRDEGGRTVDTFVSRFFTHVLNQ